MQLASFFPLLLSALALVHPSSSQPESCGPDAHIIGEDTLVRQGKDIKIITTSCPGFSNSTSSASPSFPKRQAVTQCQSTTSGCFSLTCVQHVAQPSLGDCEELTGRLDDDFPDGSTFLVRARTTVTFSYGNCKYAYQNLDTVDYNVCYSALGVLGITTTTNCFINELPTTTFTAGSCTSNHTFGNDWEIHVSHT